MTGSFRHWVGFFVALAFLNIGLSFHNIWPTPWITVRPEISMEIAALIVFLGIYQRFFGTPSNRMLTGLAAILVVLVLGRYMEVTAPALFGRRINLYWDTQYVPDVAAMLAQSAPLYLTVAVIVFVPLLLVILYFSLYWSLKRLREILALPGPARWISASMACLVALYFVSYYGSASTLGWFSIPLYQTYAQQVDFVRTAFDAEAAIEGIAEDSPIESIDPGLLAGDDLIVTFVESYGAFAFDDTTVAAILEQSRIELAESIVSTGRRSFSAFVTAPTFGGASWLSHASFMTGLNVSSNAAYNVLLTQSRPTLSSILAGSEYRSVALMPGLKNHWPEGAFYGFDAIYGADDLDYAGPSFGWWSIPDQYSLAMLDQLELVQRDRTPVFVFFPTISTHMPFRPTPPYQTDWQRIVSEQPYTQSNLGDYLNALPDYSNLSPDYAAVLDYTYSYWSGYLRESAEREFLLLLIGDHQPPAAVSGEEVRWDVPVHVVTRDSALADRLLESGFVPGLEPAPAAVAEMYELPLLMFGQ